MQALAGTVVAQLDLAEASQVGCARGIVRGSSQHRDEGRSVGVPSWIDGHVGR
jgi:hypothetical protein